MCFAALELFFHCHYMASAPFIGALAGAVGALAGAVVFLFFIMNYLRGLKSQHKYVLYTACTSALRWEQVHLHRSYTTLKKAGFRQELHKFKSQLHGSVDRKVWILRFQFTPWCTRTTPKRAPRIESMSSLFPISVRPPVGRRMAQAEFLE